MMALESDSGVPSDHGGVSRDGRWLLWTAQGNGSRDIWGKPLEAEGEARAIVASAFVDTAPAISPDGRWVVFGQGSINSRESRLVKTQVAAGPILPVAPPGRNPPWSAQAEIVVAPGAAVYQGRPAGS